MTRIRVVTAQLRKANSTIKMSDKWNCKQTEARAWPAAIVIATWKVSVPQAKVFYQTVCSEAKEISLEYGEISHPIIWILDRYWAW